MCWNSPVTSRMCEPCPSVVTLLLTVNNLLSLARSFPVHLHLILESNKATHNITARFDAKVVH